MTTTTPPNKRLAGCGPQGRSGGARPLARPDPYLASSWPWTTAGSTSSGRRGWTGCGLSGYGLGLEGRGRRHDRTPISEAFAATCGSQRLCSRAKRPSTRTGQATSLPRTRTRWAPLPRRRPSIADAGREAGTSIPDGAATRSARPRSRRSTDWIANRIVVGAGSDEIFLMLGRAYLGPGDESDLHGARLCDLRDHRASSRARSSSRSPRRNFTADVDAILDGRDAEDQDRLARQPEQSDRHLPAVRRGKAPACGPAASRVLLVLDGAYAEFVRKNDYASGIELASQHEQRDDHAHVLEALRACRACASAGAMRRPRDRCDRARAHAVQRQPDGAGGGHCGDRGRCVQR